MPNPGDRLYRIMGIRMSNRQNLVQVEFETFIVDNTNAVISTGLRSVRVPWNQEAFTSLTAAISGAVAAEPTLANFTPVG